MTDLQLKLKRCVEGLMVEYSKDYLILALKQISDQQMLHISFDEFSLLNDPILKVYEQVVQEIESVLFHPENGLLNEDELRFLVTFLLDEMIRS